MSKKNNRRKVAEDRTKVYNEILRHLQKCQNCRLMIVECVLNEK